MPQPRIMIPGIDDLSIIGHNEEHMVIKTSHAAIHETRRFRYTRFRGISALQLTVMTEYMLLSILRLQLNGKLRQEAGK